MDSGRIVALDTPEALKAEVGADRVRIETDDNEAAIAALAENFGVEGRLAEGAVIFHVAGGEEFIPRLFADFGIPIRAVSVSRPTLDDVFMSHTGTTIRDAEESGAAMRNRIMMQVVTGSRR
jgi:ABC-2 type transport system ATP-binding protein